MNKGKINKHTSLFIIFILDYFYSDRLVGIYMSKNSTSYLCLVLYNIDDASHLSVYVQFFLILIKEEVNFTIELVMLARGGGGEE